MAWQAAIPGVIGGAMAVGGLLSKKGKVSPPDITQQLLKVKGLREQQGRAVTDTYSKLPEMNKQYSTEMSKGIEDIRQRVGAGSEQYLQDTAQNTEEAKAAMRSALYGNTFSGVPAAMQAVREAGAAGAGVGSGQYLRGVQGVGESLAQRLAQGEQEIQLKGLESEASARDKTFETFTNLESKLGTANLDRIAKVMDTGRTDELQRLAIEMNLNEEETQGLIDLMNFQQSGKLASETANAKAQNDLRTALIGGGAQIIGSAYSK